ncbi:hypothetical protein [Secundilactobacillus malefermentans]|uniref:Uncharacterized protein n=1 Tax=Secundilactobacillus malefermentans TaxID=176292 RepID=A0A4R5NDG2_9LACO|nr:hypothetical protein [Secundilactobacillus malefermentans]KRM56742.1 hypothetical protein FD44_GL001574 [Secundilactobacillus malefermentans DSM 5705 = KCTC 3548]QEA30913.1 hypothetical protein FGL90_01330 [Secundilactobacillus malefermentans]TDG70862.1 hypothetical protein C5L31_001639 [Secundilactobacillus malefermentans]
MARDYVALLEQLRNGQIEDFEVEPDEFMAFHDAYLAADDRKKIVGKAQLGGKVQYIYDREEK